jgi:DNA-binding SARP family transcriptional activator
MQDSIDTLIADSLALIRAGKIPAGLKLALQAQALADGAQETLRSAQALVAQAEAYFRLGQYPQAIDLSERAGGLARAKETSPDPEEKLAALRIQAHVFHRLGCCAGETDLLGSPEGYFRQSIDLCRAVGEKRLLMRDLHSLAAGVYMPRGQFTLALASDDEAIRLAEESENSDLLWGPYTTMSWVYLLSGQLDRSAHYLELLQRVAQPDTLADGWQECIRGYLEIADGRLEQAEIHFARVCRIGERIGSPELNIFARLGRARVSRLRGKLAAAKQWAEDAYVVALRLGYQHIQAAAQVEIGRCWLEGHEYPEAESAFQAAILAGQLALAWLEICSANLGLAYIAQAGDAPQAPERIARSLTEIRSHEFFFLLDQERSIACPVLVAALAAPDRDLAELAGSLLEGLQHIPPPRLRVATLGGLKVWTGARQIDPRLLRKRRAGELLALLLAGPGCRLCLEDAAEQLWPDQSASTALDLLHQATSTLRRALEPELPRRFPSRYILVDEGTIRLNLGETPGLPAWVDFAAFEDHCLRGEWQSARNLYSGDFLPEIRFAAWTVLQREHLLGLYQECLLQCAQLEYEWGDYPAALGTCRQLLKIEPWQERAVLLGMRAAHRLNDLAAARRLYLNLAKSLRDELDAAPHEDLQAFYRSL